MDTKELKKLLTKEVNKQKLSYNQLKELYRAVRKECDLDPPVKAKTLYELPTQDELDSFYKNTIPKHRLIFKTLESTGLRVSELSKLKIQDIDFKNNTALVKQGKGKKDRIVILGNRLKELLLIYLTGKKHKYLFETNRHTKYSTRRIEQLQKYYKDLAKITKKFTVHTFRHIYFSMLAENKISKEFRAMLAGHSSEKTQDIYTHLAWEVLKKRSWRSLIN